MELIIDGRARMHIEHIINNICKCDTRLLHQHHISNNLFQLEWNVHEMQFRLIYRRHNDSNIRGIIAHAMVVQYRRRRRFQFDGHTYVRVVRVCITVLTLF